MANELLAPLVKLFQATTEHYMRRGLCYYNLKTRTVSFCGMGLVLHDLGYDCKVLENHYSLHTDFEGFIDQIKMKLWDKYKLSFDVEYSHRPLCLYCIDEHKARVRLEDLENVITHLNDVHARDFNELATMLVFMSKSYDLVTGQPLT